MFHINIGNEFVIRVEECCDDLIAITIEKEVNTYFGGRLQIKGTLNKNLEEFETFANSIGMNKAQINEARELIKWAMVVTNVPAMGPESSAHVVLGMNAIGIDADEVFINNGRGCHMMRIDLPL